MSVRGPESAIERLAWDRLQLAPAHHDNTLDGSDLASFRVGMQR